MESSMEKDDGNIIVLKKDNKRQYAQIEITILSDNRLSWGAKGLFAYMISKPPDWHLRFSDIQNRAKDGRDAVRSLIKELVEGGYLIMERKRDLDGKYYMEYTLIETGQPEVGSPSQVKPPQVKPPQVKPTLDNPSTYLYRDSNIEIDRKKEIEERDYYVIPPDADASDGVSKEDDSITKKAKKVLRYLNSTTGKKYKYVDGTLKNIKGRLRDYTYYDCIAVIKDKYQEWWGTEQQQYLRPATLFNKNHFEDYIQNIKTATTTKSLTIDTWRPVTTNIQADNMYLGFEFDEVKSGIEILQDGVDSVYFTSSIQSKPEHFYWLEQFIATVRYQKVQINNINKYLTLWQSEQKKPEVQEFITHLKEISK